MAIDFAALLSDEQKRNILLQRIQQFAAEAYQHSINRDISQEMGNEEAAKQEEESIVILTAAIQFHQNELAKLTPAE